MNKLRVFNPWAIMPRDFFDMTDWDDFQGSTRINLYENGDNVTVELEAPGYTKDDIKVNLENGILTVSGRINKESKEEDKDKKYYRKEINTMSFSRSIEIPYLVDPGKTEAKFKDGMLTITMPKQENAKPKQIEVNID